MVQTNKRLSGNKFDEAYAPLVVVGPSGAGKGTLIDDLKRNFPDMFAFSVSYTTRGIRANEQDGIHYNFVTKEVFHQMVANDEFIETAEVHGNFYGTAKAGILKIQEQKKIPLLDIDV
jgi:guanylate kinase